MLRDVCWHDNLFVTSLAHVGLLSEPILQNLQYFTLLFLLSIVETSLNRQFFLLLLLSVLTSKLLSPFFGTTCMDAAAAPEEDEEEDGEAENNDNVLQDPVAKRDVFLAFLGARNR